MSATIYLFKQVQTPEHSGHGFEVPDDSAREAAVALGLALRRRREATRKTQDEVAQAVGMNPKHYQAMESGFVNYGSKNPANPTFEKLRLLAAVLGTTVPDLMWDVFGERDVEFHPEPRF